MKNINEKTIWSNYTNCNKTVDFSGAEIVYDNYGKNKYNGWSIDHILPHSSSFIDRNENLQPLNIETNKQKSNKTVGKIIHYYVDDNENECHVKTIFRIKKESKRINNQNISYGIVYIDRQDIFINNQWHNIIKNIYFKNSQAWYFDGNNWHHSKLNIKKSIKLSCLCFEDGNEPIKWKIV